MQYKQSFTLIFMHIWAISFALFAQQYEIVYNIDVSGKTGVAIKNSISKRCTVYIRGDKVLARFVPKIPEVADVFIDGGQNKVYYIYESDTLVKDLYLLNPEQSSRQFYSLTGKDWVAGRECSVWTGEFDAPHLGGMALHTLWTDPEVSPKIEPVRLADVGSPFWTPGVRGFPLKKSIVFRGMDLTVTYTAIKVSSLKSSLDLFILPQNPRKFSPDLNVADPNWVEIESKRRILSRNMAKMNYLRFSNLVLEPPKIAPFPLPTYLIFD
jgi:hypothetical protein